jgi:hypothetical protein
VGILQAEATGLSYRKISQIFGRSEKNNGKILQSLCGDKIPSPEKNALEGSAKLPNERIAP